MKAFIGPIQSWPRINRSGPNNISSRPTIHGNIYCSISNTPRAPNVLFHCLQKQNPPIIRSKIDRATSPSIPSNAENGSYLAGRGWRSREERSVWATGSKNNEQEQHCYYVWLIAIASLPATQRPQISTLLITIRETLEEVDKLRDLFLAYTPEVNLIRSLSSNQAMSALVSAVKTRTRTHNHRNLFLY